MTKPCGLLPLVATMAAGFIADALWTLEFHRILTIFSGHGLSPRWEISKQFLTTTCSPRTRYPPCSISYEGHKLLLDLRMWEGGRLWKTFTQRVSEFDELQWLQQTAVLVASEGSVWVLYSEYVICIDL